MAGDPPGLLHPVPQEAGRVQSSTRCRTACGAWSSVLAGVLCTAPCRVLAHLLELTGFIQENSCQLMWGQIKPLLYFTYSLSYVIYLLEEEGKIGEEMLALKERSGCANYLG